MRRPREIEVEKKLNEVIMALELKADRKWVPRSHSYRAEFRSIKSRIVCMSPQIRMCSIRCVLEKYTSITEHLWRVGSRMYESGSQVRE